MSTRSRSHLPLLALVALALVVAASIPLAVIAATGSERAMAPPTAIPKTKKRTVVKRVSLGERAAKLAVGAVGVPYRWGGTSLSRGCAWSGRVRWAYRRLGVSVPHSSYALWSSGRRVSPRRLEPGDVLVFSGLGHVGLYIGRGRMVHAPQSGRDVEIVTLSRSNYGRRLVGARRFITT
jgi:cell wall-associated NlpC family hydrolase